MTEVREETLCLPPARWSEVIPNLWVGGDTDVPDGERFDLVYTLSRAAALEAPSRGVTELCWFFEDDETVPVDLRQLFLSAETVAREVREGRRVLVRCQAGLNRSALVAGMALRILGYEGDAAVGMIRDKRGEYALCNRVFHDLVKYGAYADRTVRYG